MGVTDEALLRRPKQLCSITFCCCAAENNRFLLIWINLICLFP